jgi:voltage-gated potassium channel
MAGARTHGSSQREVTEGMSDAKHLETKTVRSERIRRRTLDMLEEAKPGDKISRAFDWLLVLLILLNVLAEILDTVESTSQRWSRVLEGFETFSVLVFSVEYVLRVWSCTADPRYSRPVAGRLRFMVTPLAIVDLLAVLPSYLHTAGAANFLALRSVRLFRLIRLLKLARYSESLRTMARVLRRKRDELVATLLAAAVILVIASALIYSAEHEAQPDKFSSIPESMYWALATLTNVGYGNICPVTVAGKAIAASVALLGIGMVALPAGILGSGFIEEVQKRKAPRSTCPHCGKEL